MTEATKQHISAVLADAKRRAERAEAEEQAAELVYSLRVQERTREVLANAGIFTAEMQWKDGEYHWQDYTFTVDPEGDLFISYTHPDAPHICPGVYFLASQYEIDQHEIGDAMLRLQVTADEAAKEETFTIYEAEEYRFPDTNDWLTYAERHDNGWKVHHHDFVMHGSTAMLCVVWRKQVKVVD